MSHSQATIARQRSEMASETSIRACLLSLNGEIHHFHHDHKPILQQISMLSIIMDMALIQDHSLVPKLCYLSGASKSDVSILST